MSITEFLFVRIEQDERAARRLSEARHQLVEPIADRVLAECAAKRAIIDAHPIVEDVVEVSTHIKYGFACATCFSYGDVVEDHGYCDTLQALAAVYSGHSDYNPNWAL